MSIGIVILVVFSIILVVLVAIGYMLSAPSYKGPKTDHFNGIRFVNRDGVRARDVHDVLKWAATRRPGFWGADDTVENYGKRPLGHFKDGIRITFVNHSTFLIQVDGVNILTDPVWSRRVSPFPWIGPKRKRLPGIRLEDLPRIHVVLLSHNHYDHLDLETLRTIFGGHHPRIIVPLGVKRFLDDNAISGSEELDWWQTTRAGEMNIQAVPSQHFSGRGLFDRDCSLWCGFVIKSGAGNIYYCGDTGYHAAMFKEIGASCGPMKVSLLPIGAYQPGWFMSPIHVSPEEAVQIHRDVGSEMSIAMHFGTFPLADDGREDPVKDLEIAKARLGIAADSFIALKEGDAIVVE